MPAPPDDAVEAATALREIIDRIVITPGKITGVSRVTSTSPFTATSAPSCAGLAARVGMMSHILRPWRQLRPDHRQRVLLLTRYNGRLLTPLV